MGGVALKNSTPPLPSTCSSTPPLPTPIPIPIPSPTPTPSTARIIDPRSEVTLLIANCYQYQAAASALQAALLTHTSAVVARWAPQTDLVVLGGDWNASLRPRVGYVGAPPTVLADARLREWSEANGLVCAAPEDPTWSSYNEQRGGLFFSGGQTGEVRI